MDYRDLIVWQRSMNLTETVYRVTATFPKDERFGLITQIRRAAVSIPSNIAEGQGRRSSKDEFARFISIAMGSLCELETQLEISRRLKMMSDETAGRLGSELDEIGKMLNGLLRSQQSAS